MYKSLLTVGIIGLLLLTHNMPHGFNVIVGKDDLKELPLRILTSAPELLGEGEIVIVKEGVDRYIYWMTNGIMYKAIGTKVV